MEFTRIKNNPTRQIRRLPRKGKIRLGIKQVSRKSGNEYPVETNFFVCPPDVQAVFGEEPKALQIMFPTDDELKVFRQYYASYGSNQKLKCQGDGEKAQRRVDGKLIEMACPGPETCDFANEKDEKGKKKNPCAARFDLLFVIPDVAIGAVYQISSQSINSDIDIRSGIDMTRATFGRICWVPMELSRYETKIADPETGKMNTHWPLKLIPIGNIKQVNHARQKTDLILDIQQVYELPEPVHEGEDDTPTRYVDETDEEKTGRPPQIETTATEVKEPAPAESRGLTNQAPTTGSFTFAQLKEFISKPKSSELLENVWLDNLESLNALKNKEKIELKSLYETRIKQLREMENATP